ncbi:D-ribose pyranase [Anaerorhabdus sp.]|uniref:D-ribose pyranase n=1 Tax=bioreactor metagenome TaxID=1076179 RepID=A0A645HMP3_9ZZZZ|nr:D-ribose pyranase [Anaerorhabdus sp.]MEA4876265.1 D-ribose pyranase [Anaerorhabdus sp.]
MKKNGILNSEISKVLSDMGHTDYICIGDCGLPVPEGVKKIDLALKIGTPSFIEVLEEIKKDMVIEKIILADEIKEKNKTMLTNISLILPTQETDFMSHEDFKKMLKNAKAVIRTGEATPYSNIILISGVSF